MYLDTPNRRPIRVTQRSDNTLADDRVSSRVTLPWQLIIPFDLSSPALNDLLADESTSGRHLLVLTDARGEILWRVGTPEVLRRGRLV